ncbi:MAG: ATP-dependent DNA helicase RecG [Candidatus Omnitrophota bacterium]|nr:ATP-dependent DNA helicase RecG [Candidatus Omnitrophota bacterium]
MLRPKKTPIQYLKGVGPKKKKLFSKVGIVTVEDLLYYFPKRYEDRSNFIPISKLKLKELQTIKGTVLLANLRKSFRRHLFIFQAVITDKTAKIDCLWFNQPYLKDYLKPGAEVILYGMAQEHNGRLQLVNPEYEVIEKEKDNLSIGRIVPIYPLTEGFTQRFFRLVVKECLDEFISSLVDCLAFDLRGRRKLLNLAQSLLNIHFPVSLELQKEAYRRLSFEEFFLSQVPILLRKLKIKQAQGISHAVDEGFMEEAIAGLPFKLTGSQEQVLEDIKKDMAASKPMHRLLQGDVGSGKTIVAFLAGLIAIRAGSQAAFMVPTEILCQQHFDNAKKFISKITDFKVALLTSSLKKEEKQRLYKKVKEGKIDLVIGTHALIQQDLQFKRLGLVVIDEQHKFGVSQRQLLPAKGKYPDLLIMTATPIPRTLSLTLYGDLDISIINEMPKGRLPIETWLFNEAGRQKVYNFIQAKIKAGRQIYIVYPIIEESLVLDLKAAEEMYEKLKSEEFKQFKVGLIHGRLKEDKIKLTVGDFRNGKIDILVATTILEVGMDIPNATCMVIEHAERFGLSQLHQLRGRIGRGSEQSYCLLIAHPQSEDAKKRIKAIIELRDGFRIAEEDLKIRGPGEFFGQRQHGLSALKIANPLTQLHILKDAREEAIRLIKEDPRLQLRQHFAIKDFIERRYPEHKEVVLGG